MAFEKIIGYEEIKVELNRVLDMIAHKEKYERLGAKLPRGILLQGDPGTGKTTIAKEFIDASGLKSFTLRKYKSDGEFLDEIAKVFSRAEEASIKYKETTIVFLDDMDKFSDSDRPRRNTEEYVAIQACIDVAKDVDILVIATTNDNNFLPDSLLRAGRFDINLEVKCPTGSDAAKIVEYYLSQKKNIGEVDSNEIAILLNGRSCAQLESIINEASIIAAYEDHEKIEMGDVIKAAMKLIYHAPVSESCEESAYAKNIAYHEAGHAVVNELLEGDSVALVSIEKHTGPTGGVTVYKQNEDYFFDLKFMENRVMSMLAGKAAIEVVFGDIDVGCDNDLHRAYNIAKRFVDDYCGYGFDNREGILIDTTPGRAVADRKETIVSFQMQQYYQKTKKLLIENRGFLDALANELMEKKTIVHADIQRIKGSIY